MTELNQRKIFAKNLNKYLDIHQKTQREVADAIGVIPSTFNTWCQGIAIPRMGKVQALADYFNINKSDLIDEKEQQDDTPKIMQFYDKLNDLGKKEASKRVEELTYFPQYTDSQLLNAAHAYEGKSEEDKKHDDDIMDNDDEWT